MMQSQIAAVTSVIEEEKAAGTLYKPTQAYWDLARPTFIENWPSDLHAISIPSTIIRLDEREANTLGSYIIELGEGFENTPEEHEKVRDDLIRSIDQAVKYYPYGAFVRLGSRSPKDAMYWGVGPGEDSFCVHTGKDAWRLLTACSERVYDDLRMQLAMHYDPRIVVRAWIDLPEWSEYRCFQRNGELIGISQYYYRGVYPEIIENAESIKWAIEQFHSNLFRPANELNDVVFDVFVKMRGDQVGAHTRWEVKLLEINPFFNLTDPCLFDWNKPEEFDGRMRFTRELGTRAQGTGEIR
jgi:hypothetical protein